jgi:hypothetical protein
MQTTGIAVLHAHPALRKLEWAEEARGNFRNFIFGCAVTLHFVVVCLLDRRAKKF